MTRVAVQDPPTGARDRRRTRSGWSAPTPAAPPSTVSRIDPAVQHRRARRDGSATSIRASPGSVATLRDAPSGLRRPSGFLSRIDPRTRGRRRRRVDPNARPDCDRRRPGRGLGRRQRREHRHASRPDRPADARSRSVMARARSRSGQVPCGSPTRSTTQSCGSIRASTAVTNDDPRSVHDPSRRWRSARARSGSRTAGRHRHPHRSRERQGRRRSTSAAARRHCRRERDACG